MPPRHRRSTSTVRAQRRKLVWATFDNNAATGVGQNITVDLLNQFELAGASKLGITIMRTHLTLSMGTANSEFEVGLSIVRQTDIGTTLVNPNANNDLDWMFFKRYFATFSGATADASRVVDIDLKAKRKCQEMGQTYGLSLWSSTASQTVKIFARTLVALP